MSKELQRDEPIKPNLFIPIDWSESAKKVTLRSVIDKYLGKEEVKTEDADFEIIPPKQIEQK